MNYPRDLQRSSRDQSSVTNAAEALHVRPDRRLTFINGPSCFSKRLSKPSARLPCAVGDQDDQEHSADAAELKIERRRA
jgi:hypothetical protein